MKVHITKVAIDVFIVLIILIGWLLIHFGLPTRKTGFRCNDYSIYLPYKNSTISNTAISIMSVIEPFIVIGSTELIKNYTPNKRDKDVVVYKLVGLKKFLIIPELLSNMYIYIGSYFFGGFIVQFLTDTAKHMIGALRPHYIDICKPKFILNGINETRIDCKYKEYFHYEVDYICTNANNKLFRDAHLSYPSGHASIAFYSMVFLALYVQYTWKNNRIGLLKPFAQLFLFLIAYYTSLTRVIDNMHHLSDVLAGAILGIIFGLLCFVRLRALLNNKNIKLSSSSKTSSVCSCESQECNECLNKLAIDLPM